MSGGATEWLTDVLNSSGKQENSATKPVGGIPCWVSAQFVDKKKTVQPCASRRRLWLLYNPTVSVAAQAYSSLLPSMDVPASVLSKVGKQPVALTGCLHQKRGLSNGCNRDQVKGKDARPASVREDSFKHSRFGGI